MTKKSRYFLLTACVVFFLIAAPLMVLYVRGVDFDFKTGAFVSTGILAVRSEPSSVDVYLDGKLSRTSAGDMRFIKPGEHLITLKKTDYADWSKRLEVDSGQVVWANPSFGSVYLFFKQPPVLDVATGVTDFYYQNGRVLALAKNNLILASGSQLKNRQTFTMPVPLTTIASYDSSGKNFILASLQTASTSPEFFFFNSDADKFYNLSALFSEHVQFQISDSGQLFALDGGALYLVDPAAQTKRPLFYGVKTFGLQDGSIYFIQTQATTTPALIVTQAPFNQIQTLFSSLPSFTQGTLYVTFQKQIFLLADNSLYLLNNSMQQLATNVNLSQFEQDDSVLAIVHSGELDYFDPLGSSLDFVTRSDGTISNLQIRQNIGYALFQKDQEIEALELDARDRQNQYELYAGTNIKKAAVDSGGQNLLVLDGSELKTITIR